MPWRFVQRPYIPLPVSACPLVIRKTSVGTGSKDDVVSVKVSHGGVGLVDSIVSAKFVGEKHLVSVLRGRSTSHSSFKIG